jgi:uncharacterized membrane protein HdeD (DUF308 family)
MILLGSTPLLACSAFLALSAIFHFAAPRRAENLLAQNRPVQITGACLIVLGGWCLLVPSVTTYLVGGPVLLSGIARLFAPNRMVKVNKWTSRFVHGLLMLLGSVGCLLLVFFIG